jgi:hypothetical protein
MNLTIFSDPTTWTAIIAVLALVLSQVPPIRELIKGTKITISVPEMVSLWHFLGNISLSFQIDIANSGGRSVSIKKIETILIDSDNKVWYLPAQTYISRQAPIQANGITNDYSITRLSLKPTENWNEAIRCYRLWNESEEEEVNKITTSIVDSISSQLPSDTFYNRTFDLHKGNYKFIISAKLENNEAVGVCGYEFTIFETHIHALESHKDHYKFGEGIYFPVNRPGASAWVRLRPISDKKNVNNLYKRYRSL